MGAGVDEDLCGMSDVVGPNGSGHGGTGGIGCRVRRDHEKGEVVLLAPSDQDGVVTDGEGVDMDDLVVADQARGKFTPCVGVQADARDGSEVPGHHVDEPGRLRAEVAGTRPPRAVEIAFPGRCHLQPQKNCPGFRGPMDRVRQKPGGARMSDSVMACALVCGIRCRRRTRDLALSVVLSPSVLRRRTGCARRRCRTRALSVKCLLTSTFRGLGAA
jgi:hypothetical protein